MATRLRAAQPQVRTEILPMRTSGDRLQQGPLRSVGGKGLFVKELEQALLDRRADLAVHSVKDLPTRLPSGLSLSAITHRADSRDALVTTADRTAQLEAGQTLGTISLRRQRQLSAAVAGLQWLNLRGNLQTRLQKLAAGDCDALVLAMAGLQRLGDKAMVGFNCTPLSPEQCLPAAGQGALGVETRSDDQRVRQWLEPLHHPPSARCVIAERRVCRLLDADCGSAIGVWAQLDGDRIELRAAVAGRPGQPILRSCHTAAERDADSVAEAVASELLTAGAAAYLHEGDTED